MWGGLGTGNDVPPSQSIPVKSHFDTSGDSLAMIDAMQTVNTEDVAPLSHPLDGAQRLRQDLVTETEQRNNFQSTAPSTSEGYYLVPRVVD